MKSIVTNEDIPYETMLNLTLKVNKSSQIPSIGVATALYNILRSLYMINFTAESHVRTVSQQHAN